MARGRTGNRCEAGRAYQFPEVNALKQFRNHFGLARSRGVVFSGEKPREGLSPRSKPIAKLLSLRDPGGNHVHSAVGRKRCPLLPADDMAGVVAGEEDAALRLGPYFIARRVGVVVRHW